MLVRLSVLTGLMALFAMGFSSLVAMERPSNGPVAMGADCSSNGLVCAPRPVRTGL